MKQKIKQVCDIDKCIGCRSCENICPKSAISMKTNKKGFLRPIIDENHCVNCGLCEKVCNYSKQNYVKTLENKFSSQMIYGMKNKNDKIRKESSSGGIFYSIAVDYINKGGVVYGCILDENIKAVFSRANDISQLGKMMGSKYVFSDLINTFSNIEKDLKCKKAVLFTGSPCQCWELRQYLNVKNVNVSRLLIIEFLCHGYPSPEVFNDYKKTIEDKYKGKMVDFKFRDKEKIKNPPSCRGMRSKILTLSGDLIDVYDEKLNDRYFELFKRNYISNDACYECKFVGFDNRAGDISIADFWGCEHSYPDFFDKQGVSLVLVNTEKGFIEINRIKECIDFIEVERSKCLQAPLKSTPQKPKDSEQFWDLYQEKGYTYANKKIVNKYLYQKKYYNFRKGVKALLIKVGILQ